MTMDPRLVSVLGLEIVRGRVPVRGADSRLQIPHVAFQTSTLEALVDGAWRGEVSIEQLLRHGDLGLGTFDDLDGEMIVLDGEVWRACSDGRIVRVGEAEGTPYALVTPFTPTVTVELRAPLDHDALLAAIGAAAEDLRGAYAIRFDGLFAGIRARSVAPQRKPYPTMAEVAAAQCRFSLGPAAGTLVGFWFPSWASGTQPPGFHLHAITADRRRGGHVLDARVGPGTLRLDPLAGLDVHLPRGVALPDGSLAAPDADVVAYLEAGGRG